MTAQTPEVKTRVVTRMTRSALEDEVRRLRAEPSGRTRDLLRANTAVREAQRDAAEQRRLRVAAEKNAARFHALMLQARINLIILRKNTP